MGQFKIKILDQYWVDKNPNNKDDLCSHGLLSITADELTITDENDIDWTLSTTGLTLLRTLSNDFISADSSYPIVQHCGQLGMIGCPISLTWDVIHNGELVTLKNFQKLLTTNEKDAIKFGDKEIQLDSTSYIREVVRFADNIKDFFDGHPRTFSDDHYKNDYESFWIEFNKLLDKNRERLKRAAANKS